MTLFRFGTRPNQTTSVLTEPGLGTERLPVQPDLLVGSASLPVNLTPKRTVDWLVVATVVSAIGFSISCFVHFYRLDLIVAFGDAQARQLLGRSVVDNPTGTIKLTELGPIWPPLPELLNALTAGNDWMYRSGLSGGIVSMIAYVVAATFIFLLVRTATQSSLGALAAVCAFSVADIGYMQSVPMSEIPFVAFFVAAIFFFFRWVCEPDRTRYLVGWGIAMVGGILTRYESWVLFGLNLGVWLIIMFSFWKQGRRYKWLEDRFVMGLFFGLYAMGVTFAFQKIIFGDWLYFARSEFSPWAIAAQATEKSAGNFPLSVAVYSQTVWDDAGPIGICMATMGLVFMVVRRKIPFVQQLALLPLMFAYPFFVVMTYIGTSVVIWHPDYFNGANWGTRYGTMMTPAIAVFAGLFVGWWRWGRRVIQPALLAAVVCGTILTWQTGSLALGEAIGNYFKEDGVSQRDAGLWLKDHYDNSGPIMLWRFANDGILFWSGLDHANVVYEGSGERWTSALNHPPSNVDWIVMRVREDGQADMIYQELHGSPLLADYGLVYHKAGVEIYKKQPVGNVAVVNATPIPAAEPASTAVNTPVATATPVDVAAPPSAPQPTAPTLIPPRVVVTISAPVPAQQTSPAPPVVATQPTTLPAVAAAPPMVTPTQTPPAPEVAPVAPPMAAEIPPAQATVTRYLVQKGDSLWKISLHFYETATGWTRIYEANRDQIKDPNVIYPGQDLVIP